MKIHCPGVGTMEFSTVIVPPRDNGFPLSLPWDNDFQYCHCPGVQVLSALSALIYYNVIITPLPSGQLEIIPPSGHSIPPSGCIIPPSGRLDLRSTASLRRDNAALRRNNVSFRQYNFHCPSGQGVIISHFN